MIYLDTSVALAQLLAEDRRPPPGLWTRPLISSRLLEYEVWSRIHARALGDEHGSFARDLLARVAMIELSPLVLERTLEPFPIAVRTLEALHLASLEYLRSIRRDVELATYDDRMTRAARAASIPLFALD